VEFSFRNQLKLILNDTKMKKILLICIASLSIAIFAQNKPNIVLIVSDDHGRESVGCYGNPVIQTPAIDKLATQSVRFNNAFCTSASCSASRSVLLTAKFSHATGHYGHEHEYHHFSTFNNEKSLTHYLENGGYRTARVGKYHVAPESVYHFQTVFKANDRNPVEMADVTKEFITDSKDKPFFLYYCSSDPHRDGLEVDVPYKPNSFGNREDGFYPGIKEVHYDPKDVIVPPFLPDTPEARAELAQYYQSVSRLDQGIGRLVSHLKDAGVYDNTIIIYISDNGIAFPGAKTTLYEPGMRLPCIIKKVNQKKPEVKDNLVSWVDLTPTILELVGLYPSKNTFHGKSFKSILDNPKVTTSDEEEIFASHTFHEVTMYYPMRVIENKKYKFIYNIAHKLDYPCAKDLWDSPTWQSAYKGGLNAYYGKRTIDAYLHRPMFELYDVINDPNEINNLAYNKDYLPVQLQFVEKMKLFQKQTKDPWIVKWEHE
jgi:N-sulfoglucosamine sulfohydrolase